MTREEMIAEILKRPNYVNYPKLVAGLEKLQGMTDAEFEAQKEREIAIIGEGHRHAKTLRS